MRCSVNIGVCLSDGVTRSTLRYPFAILLESRFLCCYVLLMLVGESLKKCL